MYAILEDRYGRLSYAPENWIKVGEDSREIVFWPKKDLSMLLNDPRSEPVFVGEYKWLTIKDKIKRRGLPTKDAAEKEIDIMSENTRTETDETEMDEDEIPSVGTRRKQVNKTPKAHCVIPKFTVPNVAKTPPSSALSHRIISTGSPKTPTNRIDNLLPLSIQQQHSITGTPPSSMMHDDLTNLSPLFSGENSTLQTEFEAISSECV